jgi:hypothetical protein
MASGACATSAVARNEELSREAQRQANQELKWYYDNESMLVIKTRLPAEAG